MSKYELTLYATAAEIRKLQATERANHGEPYSADEISGIVEGFASGMSLETLCDKYARPPSGILDKLRKAGVVVKEATSQFNYDVLITKRGASAIEAWAETRGQRGRLVTQAEKLTQQESDERLVPVPSHLSPTLAERQQLGRGLRPAGLPEVRIVPCDELLASSKGKSANTEGCLHDNYVMDKAIETNVEKIMNKSVYVETRVYLNNKLLSDYSDNDLLTMVGEQEAKIKFLSELTEAQSTRRDELLASAKKDRDALLALLDTRAKGGKTAIEVSDSLVTAEKQGD